MSIDKRLCSKSRVLKSGPGVRHFPGATCTSGDRGGVASLRPQQRKAWLAENRLPAELRYYSVVTFPQPKCISRALQSSYRKLASIDGRNDSQVIFYDEVIPGSALIAYVNADRAGLIEIDRERRAAVLQDDPAKNGEEGTPIELFLAGVGENAGGLAILIAENHGPSQRG